MTPRVPGRAGFIDCGNAELGRADALRPASGTTLRDRLLRGDEPDQREQTERLLDLALD
ncbi:hypothetical protein [Streptomyces cellulosae]|uniref:hypothetical protein n=1 Tax=Streptomyces cellulosae TaxID=1968 RepID=UPI00131BFE8B|nr:hypothetical protein [Streptomyces cellulosae]